MNFNEFVARTENICFRDAVYVLLPIYMNAHNWNVDDSVASVYERKFKHILDIILVENTNKKIIVGKAIYSIVLNDYGDPQFRPDTGEENTELNMFESNVNVKSLVKFVIEDLLDESYVPDELLQLAGGKASPDQSPNLEPKYDPKTDRLVCQGIARTLWDIEPNMSLKDMANHKAIQMYGNGSQYKDPKTLPRWLSEVDPRPKDKR